MGYILYASFRFRDLILIFILAGGAGDAFAFTCYDTTGAELNSASGSGSSRVYVNLQPTILPGQNLVVDLSGSIFCRNDQPSFRDDLVRMFSSSAYAGALTSFRGSVRYYGGTYNFPLNSPTNSHNFTSGSYSSWNAQLYLTPVSTASGVLIKNGDLFARLVLHQLGRDKGTGGNVHEATFTWDVYAANSVVVPTGGCDVSARDVTISLPDYPGTASVPLTVRCARSQKLAFYLSGSTVDSANSIFSNTALASKAQGVGVNVMRNGSVLSANNNVSIGNVDSSPVNLGLTVGYARTGGQVTAGSVQSIIGVTFVYE